MISFCILWWAFSLSLANAHRSLQPAVRIRHAPELSPLDTIVAVRRAIGDAARNRPRDTVLKNSTHLETSWNNAPLLKFGAEATYDHNNKTSITVEGSVEIICATCYVKGNATAEFSIKGDTNATQILNQTISSFQNKIENFTDTVEDYLKDYAGGIFEKLQDGVDKDDFDFPTFPYNFSMDIPTIPECNLRFQFDGLELYMQIDTTLSLGATYTLNLYSSTTPLGIRITEELQLGIIFGVDLILSVQGEIDISSGFHIKLNDGVALNIAMFGDQVSDIVFNGGRFEFLPVTIESAGVVFSAVLRIGVHSGFELATPDLPEITIGEHQLPALSGGIEVGVFANVAEFTTNVTHSPKEDCKLNVVQSYQLALGAAAGATIAINTHRWGPAAETSIPIFFTEIASACAKQKTVTTSPSAAPAITPKAALKQRADLTTTSTEVTNVYTAVHCNISTLINCPVSLQNTTRYTETTTIVTALPSSSALVVTNSITEAALTTVTFGKAAETIPSLSGSPASYVPPPPKSTDGNGNINGTTGSNHKPSGGEDSRVNKRLIVGLSVGIGVPVLIALVAGTILVRRRRKAYSAVPNPSHMPLTVEPYEGVTAHQNKTVKPNIEVTEVEHH